MPDIPVMPDLPDLPVMPDMPVMLVMPDLIGHQEKEIPGRAGDDKEDVGG